MHEPTDAAFILKCTRQCNLRCTYCTDRRGSRSPTFDVELLATLFDGVARDEAIASCAFIWHGGEPLLMGLPFFRKAVHLQNRFLLGRKPFLNSLQTNAGLLDGDWAAHFAEYGFSIGVSLDGPQELHDRRRPTAGGKKSFEATLSGVRTLERFGVHCGVLTVVSEELLVFGPEKLLEFAAQQGISRLALLSLRKDWDSAEEALAYSRTFGQYMTSMTELWFAKDDVELQIRELRSKLDVFFGLPHAVCKDGGECVGKYFGVEADGSVWHCDKFSNDSRFKLGNLHTETVSQIRASDKMAVLVDLERKARAGCEPCKWFELCQGGCLFDLLYFKEIGGAIGTPDCFQFAVFEDMAARLGSNSVLLEAANRPWAQFP